MGLLNFRYGYLLSAVIPAPAYARTGYGRNPVLSAQKSVGQKGFLNSAFWIPACAGMTDGVSEAVAKKPATLVFRRPFHLSVRLSRYNSRFRYFQTTSLL